MVSRLVVTIALGMFVFCGLSVEAAGVDPVLKCKDAKGKAAGSKALTLMKAFGKHMKTPNDEKLASDISKAQSNFSKGFSKAEQKVECGIDAGGVEPQVDNCVENLIGLIGGATTTTTTTAPGSTTTTTLVPCGLPATGQTTCWNSSGIPIPCSGTEQDGDIRAGAPLAYMDNGDGTITDLNTGLMWEKKSDDDSIHDKDSTYTWNNAFAVHVAGLNTANFAGHSDWRLPNIKQLQSIVDYEVYDPSVLSALNTGCAEGCTVLTCSCTQASVYWSSTSYAHAPDSAWFMNFGSSYAFSTGKDTIYYVRAVRGGL